MSWKVKGGSGCGSSGSRAVSSREAAVRLEFRQPNTDLLFKVPQSCGTGSSTAYANLKSKFLPANGTALPSSHSPALLPGLSPEPGALGSNGLVHCYLVILASICTSVPLGLKPESCVFKLKGGQVEV